MEFCRFIDQLTLDFVKDYNLAIVTIRVSLQPALQPDPQNSHYSVLEVAYDGTLPQGENAPKNPRLEMELISVLSDQLQGSVHGKTDIPT
jgi:hypothetical protein